LFKVASVKKNDGAWQRRFHMCNCTHVCTRSPLPSSE